MKKAVLAFFSNLLLISIFPSDSLAQQQAGQINLLEGRIQETGLPNGWDTAADNFNCTVSFQNGSIFFERMSPNEKCSFFFSRQGVPNGEYRLITNFVIDGNNPRIILNGRDLRFESAKAVKDTIIIKVTDGRLNIDFSTRGSGKVWGKVTNMILTNVSVPSALSTSTIDKINGIVLRSPINSYRWKDRGIAPAGYIKGVALTYAKSYYELKSRQKTAVAAMSQPIADPRTDALAYYGITAVSDVDRLRSVYTLALGLGMRESSGNPTTGWDRSKLKQGIKNTEENAEAGLFQVSWDSRGKSPWLLKLYDQYKASTSQCYLAIFMEKVRDDQDPEVGNGEGAFFQRLTKKCPSFATEYATVMLRTNRKHFGPINTKKAEYNLDTESMFRDIESVVEKTMQ